MNNDWWDYLEHSAIGTTWSKSAHKYLAKIGNKYYYTQAEIDAARRGLSLIHI